MPSICCDIYWGRSLDLGSLSARDPDAGSYSFSSYLLVIVLIGVKKWLFLTPRYSEIYYPTATLLGKLNITSADLFTFVIIYWVFIKTQASFTKSYCTCSKSLFVMIP